MGAAAVAAAKAVGYAGAGTVEFIADGANGLKRDGFWFMEMNTRLQVEHPVTEAITGFDLVEWQFRVAAGERLPVTNQAEIPLRGHAVEARLYAEDPERGFPAIDRNAGGAVNFRKARASASTAAWKQGGEISPYYDPMIAKVIAHADTRQAALDRLASALDRTLVAGPRTNLAFLGALCRSPDFRDGKFDTGYIARHRANSGSMFPASTPPPPRAAPCTCWRRQASEGASPWDSADGFQLSGPRKLALPIVVNGNPEIATCRFFGRADAVCVYMTRRPTWMPR